jgi:mono/diheme cytochrome c family protein
MLNHPLPGPARLALALLAGLALACGMGDELLEEVDPAALPSSVSYVQHIKPRMDYACGACHNPDSALGNGGGWNFSSYALVRASFDSIHTAAFEARRMPPGGARRLTAEDAAIFRRWQKTGFLEGK